MIRQFIQTNILVLFLSNFVNIGNYLMQMFLGRALTPSQFGNYNAVLGLGTILSFFCPVISSIVPKFLIEVESDSGKFSSLYRFFVRSATFISLTFSAVLFALTPWFSNLLKLPSVIPVLIYMGCISSLLIMAVLRGLLTVKGKYVYITRQLAWNMLIKLFVTIIAVKFLNGGYNQVLLVTLIANIIIDLRMWFHTRRIFNPELQPNPPPISKELRRQILLFAAPSSSTWLIINLITNLDILLVQYFCSPEQAGTYAVASLLAKITIFLPDALLAVLFPEIARNRKNPGSLTVITMLLTLSVSGVYLIFVSLFSEFLIRLTFGDTHLTASQYLPVITGAMLVFTLCNVMFQQNLALNRYYFLIPAHLGVAVAILMVVARFNNNPSEIAFSILMGTITMFLGCLAGEAPSINRWRLKISSLKNH